MVRVTEKGLAANSWNKRNIFFFVKRMAKSRSNRTPRQSNIQYVTWWLHIVAEMVSLSQREKEFWILSGILSKEHKQSSPI